MGSCGRRVAPPSMKSMCHWKDYQTFRWQSCKGQLMLQQQNSVSKTIWQLEIRAGSQKMKWNKDKWKCLVLRSKKTSTTQALINDL